MSPGDISKWQTILTSQQLSIRHYIAKGSDEERVHLFSCLLYHSSSCNVMNCSHLRQNWEAASDCYRSNVQLGPTASISAEAAACISTKSN